MNSVVLKAALVSVLRRRPTGTSRWVDVDPVWAVCVDIWNFLLGSLTRMRGSGHVVQQGGAPMGPTEATPRGSDFVTRISQLLGTTARRHGRHPGTTRCASARWGPTSRAGAVVCTY